MNNTSKITVDALLHRPDSPIGFITPAKSHPISPKEFSFWMSVSSDAQAKLVVGDIVAAKHEPTRDWDMQDVTMAEVVGMQRLGDVDSPLLDYVRHDLGERPTNTTKTELLQVMVVKCRFLRNMSGRTRPVDTCAVYYASALGIRFALQEIGPEGVSEIAGNWIPAGLYKSGCGVQTPISVNENYLVGPEAAHVNVTGISGLGSKTSYLLFLISSLMQKKSESKRVGVIFVNVKKSDFMWLDKENPKLIGNPELADVYTDIGLLPKLGLSSVSFWATQGDGPIYSHRADANPITYSWWELSRSIHTMFSKEDLDLKAEAVIEEAIENTLSGSKKMSYNEMLAWLSTWEKSKGHEATVKKVNARLNHLRPKLNQILNPVSKIGKFPDLRNLKDKEGIVIDLALISHPNVQQLIFKDILSKAESALASNDKLVDAIIVVADELNKFCPSGNFGSAPLKHQIVDIAARGRSAGLVLFGAEQFASEISQEVYGNSTTKIIGRSSVHEISSSIYKYLPDDIKTEAITLPQGRMVFSTVTCPEFLPISFPFPPVATDSTIKIK